MKSINTVFQLNMPHFNFVKIFKENEEKLNKKNLYKRKTYEFQE